MANAAPAEFTPSIDRKKGRFLGLFCRKTGVRRKLFNTLLCVFTFFWDSGLSQTLAPQGEPARGRLQNKSCLKTYRRFFVRSGMCLNKPVKVVMTGRDEGCGRRAALRAVTLLNRSYAIARGAHAPSPSQAGEARNSGATRQKRVQSYPTGLQLPARNCTKLHQIAPDCTRLRSLRQKIKREKTRAEEKYSAPIYRPHLLACKVAEASRLLVVKAPRLDAAATFPGSLMPASHRLSGTLNLVGFNLRQSNLIQVNPTKNEKTP
jgi:hypothetical protein